MAMVFDTPEAINFFQLAARKGALGMELRGMKRRGQSAYAICKQVYGLKGTKQAVYDQMCTLVERELANS